MIGTPPALLLHSGKFEEFEHIYYSTIQLYQNTIDLLIS